LPWYCAILLKLNHFERISVSRVKSLIISAKIMGNRNNEYCKTILSELDDVSHTSQSQSAPFISLFHNLKKPIIKRLSIVNMIKDVFLGSSTTEIFFVTYNLKITKLKPISKIPCSSFFVCQRRRLFSFHYHPSIEIY